MLLQYSAVVRNRYGSGKSYYMGTSLDEESLNRLFDEILESA
ncbi:MAG: beta-galactosidase trimerization domain-containing protein [Erysipelotrichaceae bacterium]|nr:beta-galactosidase trimerization domain-containing protein [Erysipelotrichaceae bacterium]